MHRMPACLLTFTWGAIPRSFLASERGTTCADTPSGGVGGPGRGYGPGRGAGEGAMRVRDIMNTDVATATAGTAISEVAKLMAARDVGAVVILEGDRPVGIVTDRDLVIDHLAEGHTQDHAVRE